MVRLGELCKNGRARELFRGKKHLHQTGPEPPHQSKDQEASQRSRHQTDEGSPNRAKGIAAGNLQRLPGNDGKQDLEKHHSTIDQQTAQFSPPAIGGSFLDQKPDAPSAAPHLPADQNGCHQKEKPARSVPIFSAAALSVFFRMFHLSRFPSRQLQASQTAVLWK